MLPYLMAGSLIAGFVTAWLQSHPQSTKLPVSDRILKMRKELGMTQRQLPEGTEPRLAASNHADRGRLLTGRSGGGKVRSGAPKKIKQ